MMTQFPHRCTTKQMNGESHLATNEHPQVLVQLQGHCLNSTSTYTSGTMYVHVHNVDILWGSIWVSGRKDIQGNVLRFS